MATTPGPNAIDSGSTERDAEDRRFQRLERVRARQRSSRLRRLILISTLVLALAGAGVLGFTAVRRASLEHSSAAGVQAPIGAPAVPVAPVAETPAPPTMSVPTLAPAEGMKTDAALPRRVQSESPPPAPGVTPPAKRPIGSAAPPRSEPGTPDTGDGSAAIDWLLKTSRTKDQ